MPALPSVPSVVRVGWTTDVSADLTAFNRRYFQYTGTAPTDAELVTFATAIATGWNTHMAGLFSAQCVLTGVACEDLSSPTAAVGAWTGTHDGTRAGAFLSAGAAAVLSLKIARRYRGGHPRTYLAAGVAPDLLSPQTWQAAFTAAVVTGWENWAGDIAAANWAGSTIAGDVNVSYYQGFTPFLEPSGRYRNIPKLRAVPVIDPILTFSVNPNVGSQRRRNLIV